ncbi:uncharacterized protein EI97DRAFT_499693 [Westerdykella ornata]|uniref:Uncharacterized protein n=1 Tax=Westerdykella ornata TaxID=318751 RepID=A0A6A6JP61_WESOR|nr:uncharacterized protein EI97DRAFT_499693 [Westerdykella ornata]KAF2278187.1 hypothetical protein EI97DRAFT_499693 [Westerdykella ornata]
MEFNLEPSARIQQLSALNTVVSLQAHLRTLIIAQGRALFAVADSCLNADAYDVVLERSQGAPPQLWKTHLVVYTKVRNKVEQRLAYTGISAEDSDGAVLSMVDLWNKLTPISSTTWGGNGAGKRQTKAESKTEVKSKGKRKAEEEEGVGSQAEGTGHDVGRQGFGYGRPVSRERDRMLCDPSKDILAVGGRGNERGDVTAYTARNTGQNPEANQHEGPADEETEGRAPDALYSPPDGSSR